MAYLVTARKWRPMIFEDVVGQSHVTATLRNAIASNRLAHAYLFSGPRGTGKTTMARLLAKAINCRNPKDLNPCNECDVCEEITNSRSIDVFEIDGASNRGIEEIRNLRDAVRYGPSKCRYKLYIIDEVHMLTKEAFNALLKTLEEPPAYILFVFATTEVQKVPLTILSRCHRFDFRRIAIDEIINRLRYIAEQEKIAIDDDSLLLIAKKGDGSLRDAQSIFDQVVSFCGENITSGQLVEALNLVDQELFFNVTDLIKAKNTRGGLELVDEIIKRGYDIREFLSGLGEHLRNLLIACSTGSTTLIESSEAYRKRYLEDSRLFSESDLLRLMRIVTETENSVKWSTQPRVRLETGLLQMIKLDSTLEIQELLQQIEELRKKINGTSRGDPTSRNSTRGGSLFSPSGEGNSSLSSHSRKSDDRLSSPQKVTHQTPSKVSPPSSPTSGDSGSLVKEPATFYEAKPEVGQKGGFPLDREKKTVQVISFEEIQSRWKEFVEEIRRERIHVGTLLSQARPLDVSDGAIKLCCTDGFHLSSLKRSKDFLAQSAQKIYGKKVRFELSLDSSVPANELPKNTAEGEKNSKPSTLDHPVIKALMRELGAEPLQ